MYQREVAVSFNSGGTGDCARLSHGGSFSVRLSPWVWSPLVYHEQRRSRRFHFQQLSGHPHAEVPHSLTYTRDCGRALPLLARAPDVWGDVWHLSTARPPLTGREFVALAARECGVEPEVQIL